MERSLPTLYSFRRCPYAMRARLALAVSGQAVLLREVELNNRPAEIYAVSPKGTVPVLVLADGTVLDESLEIMHWTLSKSDPESWLPATPELEKAMNELVHRCDGDFKHHLDRYKYANRYAGACAQEHRSAASAFLLHLEERLQANTFLLQDKPCLADMALAPFVRQFAFADRDWFDTQPWPHLRAWLDAFVASPRFLNIMQKHSSWVVNADPLKIDWS